MTKPQRPKTGQSKRGGKRKGAGRPAGTPNPNAGRRITKMTAGARVPEVGLAVNVTARISENAYAAIAACCATDQISQSDFLRDAIYARLDAIYPKWNQ